MRRLEAGGWGLEDMRARRGREEREAAWRRAAVTGREVMRREVAGFTIAITGREVVSLDGTVLGNLCSTTNIYFFITFKNILSTQI